MANEVSNYAAARGITLFNAMKELACMARQMALRKLGLLYIVRYELRHGMRIAVDVKAV